MKDGAEKILLAVIVKSGCLVFLFVFFLTFSVLGACTYAFCPLVCFTYSCPIRIVGNRCLSKLVKDHSQNSVLLR